MVVPWWASSGLQGRARVAGHGQTAAEESGLGAPEPCREVVPSPAYGLGSEGRTMN